MKKPAKPGGHATLFELAMEDENARHAARVADLKRMQPRLGLLDAFAPAVNAAGLTLEPQEIHSWGGKTLWLVEPSFLSEHNVKLAALLIELGMSQVERYDYPSGDYTLELEKGRLRVAIRIDRHAVAEAAPGGVTCA